MRHSNRDNNVHLFVFHDFSRAPLSISRKIFLSLPFFLVRERNRLCFLHEEVCGVKSSEKKKETWKKTREICAPRVNSSIDTRGGGEIRKDT